MVTSWPFDPMEWVHRIAFILAYGAPDLWLMRSKASDCPFFLTPCDKYEGDT